MSIPRIPSIRAVQETGGASVVAEDPDSGQKLDLDEMGEGTRNMVLLSLLRSYAKNFRGADEKIGGLLALEEPEIYMHPQARRHLFKVLREIAAGGIQVIISTHSASFLDMEFFEAIGRVVKVDDDENPGRKQTTVHRVSRTALVDLCLKTGAPVDLVNKDKISGFYKTTTNPMLNEAFFARFVILGEGDTEELGLPVLLAAHGVDCDLLGISVIGVKGKSQIPKYWRLLTAFGIPVLAIADNDEDRRSEDKQQSNKMLANCFGVSLAEFSNIEEAKVIRRQKPAGSLLLQEKDYETSLRASYAKYDAYEGGERVEQWEKEADEHLGPRANKGLKARCVARKLVAEAPEFRPKMVSLIIDELRGAGILKREPDIVEEADDDDIPF